MQKPLEELHDRAAGLLGKRREEVAKVETELCAALTGYMKIPATHQKQRYESRRAAFGLRRAWHHGMMDYAADLNGLLLMKKCVLGF